MRQSVPISICLVLRFYVICYSVGSHSIIALTLIGGNTIHSIPGCAVKSDNSLLKYGIKIATAFLLIKFLILLSANSISVLTEKYPEMQISILYSLLILH